MDLDSLAADGGVDPADAAEAAEAAAAAAREEQQLSADIAARGGVVLPPEGHKALSNWHRIFKGRMRVTAYMTPDNVDDKVAGVKELLDDQLLRYGWVVAQMAWCALRTPRMDWVGGGAKATTEGLGSCRAGRAVRLPSTDCRLLSTVCCALPHRFLDDHQVILMSYKLLECETQKVSSSCGADCVQEGGREAPLQAIKQSSKHTAVCVAPQQCAAAAAGGGTVSPQQTFLHPEPPPMLTVEAVADVVTFEPTPGDIVCECVCQAGSSCNKRSRPSAALLSAAAVRQPCCNSSRAAVSSCTVLGSLACTAGPGAALTRVPAVSSHAGGVVRKLSHTSITLLLLGCISVAIERPFIPEDWEYDLHVSALMLTDWLGGWLVTSNTCVPCSRTSGCPMQPVQNPKAVSVPLMLLLLSAD